MIYRILDTITAALAAASIAGAVIIIAAAWGIY